MAAYRPDAFVFYITFLDTTNTKRIQISSDIIAADRKQNSVMIEVWQVSSGILSIGTWLIDLGLDGIYTGEAKLYIIAENNKPREIHTTACWK